ncbi:glycoside hydrolase family 3 N-terminal domain-containing protein [uncultured Bacteroides sp.]|uniref:glycoside hydrolase family 3 N-terminal domain-containing protein n=1 Tax=uncultured Bacteroides sp. TaxID=162156 RepID=UPI00280C223A|nr:glycoside hydrolase family 3 N-terminal domain-containing protein [uncultured Bacteroides sp.]
MKKLIAYLCMMIFVLTSAAQGQTDESKMNRFVSGLMKKMTLEEKVGQLSQCSGGFATGPDNTRISRTEDISKGLIGSLLNVSGAANTRKYQEAAMKSRLRIPLIFGLDVIHGFRTGFPLPLAEAASFDLDAIERGSRCAAKEASAAGLHWTFAPMVDIGWDARWGRVMEGAGEDPYYGSLVAKARVHGLQGDDLSKENTILSCIKHFAGYGASTAGKDYNSVDMSMGQFANFYMPPYKAGVEAGAATFMSAFNDFNNEPATGSSFLLRELLKNQWGFKGFVVSDWGSVGEMINHRYAKDEKEAAYKGIKAGLDMEMVSECYSKNLVSLVKEGKVSVKLVDDAVRRILEQKYKLGLFDDPFRYCDEERERTVIGSEESRKEACYVAERSVVLLKNEGAVLPLSPSVKKVALVGALAKSQKDMCGAWSCAEVSKVVTLYEAMEKRGVTVNYNDGYDLKKNQIVNLEQTLAAARQSDVVVIAMGEQAWESGEMRSKGDISISSEQQRLVSELVKTGKPVVVLMMCGRPVIFNEVRRDAPAILCTWWLGSEAGNAICNVLFGDYNPSGKLPMTFPQHNGQIPLYYQYKSTGRPTALGGWCAKYIDIPTEPAYPFGYGLSYTTFEYSDVKLLPGNGNTYARVAVTVKNTGTYEGEEVVQLYVRDEVASITRPIKELKGFDKIKLKVGESRTVTFDVKDEQLGFYNNQMKFVVEKGDFTFMVGGNSRDLQEIKYTLN